jgi:hypothetical protein
MVGTIVIDSTVMTFNMSLFLNLCYDLASISKFSIYGIKPFLEQLFMHMNVKGFHP